MTPETIALLLTTALDPCAPVAPEAVQRPEEAAAYAAVAREEEARGSEEAAAVAWRRAAALDVTRADARGALAGACQAAAAAEDFREALALLDRGDRRGALARFEAARRRGPSPAAALLAGLCWYELGDDGKAQPLLEEARAEPTLASSAAFFLGLVALRRGQSALAESLLEGAAADVRLGSAARSLRQLAARDGRLVVSASLEGGYDSNVDLDPAARPLSGKSDDGVATAEVSLLARPLGRAGPYALVTGGYRKLLHLSAWDAAALAAGAGWQLDLGRESALAEYRYEFDALGGAPYVGAHALAARLGLRLGPAQLAADYAGRFEQYFPAALAAYSGQRHGARLRAAWQLGGAFRAEAGWAVTRGLARLPELSLLEHGPELSVLVTFRRELRLALVGAIHFRAYDAVDPDLGVAREDTIGEGRLRLEADVARLWTVFLSAEARADAANVAALRSFRVAGAAGVAFTLGAL